jgi:hypothetical protein
MYIRYPELIDPGQHHPHPAMMCGRLRRVRRMLAMAHQSILPSAMLNGVGTSVAILSQLNTCLHVPAVNASIAASRLTAHDSGSGWLATLSSVTFSFTNPRRFIRPLRSLQGAHPCLH